MFFSTFQNTVLLKRKEFKQTKKSNDIELLVKGNLKAAFPKFVFPGPEFSEILMGGP